MSEKLRVRAVEGRLVADPEALDAGMRRFVGWRHKGVVPVELLPDGVDVEDSAHIRDAVRRGELVACDPYTAGRCKVDWKPSAKAGKKGEV